MTPKPVYDFYLQNIEGSNLKRLCNETAEEKNMTSHKKIVHGKGL